MGVQDLEKQERSQQRKAGELLLLLHVWFRLLLLFPWKQLLGKREQGKGFKILTLKPAAYSVFVGSCSTEQEWKYLANHHCLVTCLLLLQHG